MTLLHARSNIATGNNQRMILLTGKYALYRCIMSKWVLLFYDRNFKFKITLLRDTKH